MKAPANELFISGVVHVERQKIGIVPGPKAIKSSVFGRLIRFSFWGGGALPPAVADEKTLANAIIARAAIKIRKPERKQNKSPGFILCSNS